MKRGEGFACGMYWLIPGAILCSWALLRLMGAEREVQLRTMRALVESESLQQRGKGSGQDPANSSDIPTLSAPATGQHSHVPPSGTV